MKALFLAGGMGIRLKPLTDHLPKPMVPIMGKPLLERSIRELWQCGVTEIILSTCYRSDFIKNYFEKVTGRLGIQIHYVSEDIPLGTGGAIKNCEQYFDDTFFIFNSDILSNLNLKELLAFHRKKNADITIAATRVADPSNYGVIEYDSLGFATTFTEKPRPGEEKSNFINAGVYVFEPKVLNLIPARKIVSIEKDGFPLFLKKGYKVAVYREGSYWIDIGTPEKYMQVHKDIFDGRCRIPETEFKGKGVYGLSNAEIHSTSHIMGPVWFGKRVRIGANVTIGPNVVVGDGFETGRGCVIQNSIIWNNVAIGSGVSISHSVVTSGCHIGSGIQCANTIYSQESKRPFVI